MTIQFCGDGICYEQQAKIDVVCHDLDKQPGTWIILSIAGKTCYCVCYAQGGGDFAPSALVATPEWVMVPISQIVQGVTHVLAAGTSLHFMSYPAKYAEVVALRQAMNCIHISYFAGGAQRNVVVLSSALYLLHSDRTLRRADRLQLADKLIDANGLPVNITKIQSGTFSGSVAGIATVLEKPGPGYSGHLLVIDHVVVGDDAIAMGVPTECDDRCVVGSTQWLADNPQLLTGDVRQPLHVANGTFYPASYFQVDIPEWSSD